MIPKETRLAPRRATRWARRAAGVTLSSAALLSAPACSQRFILTSPEPEISVQSGPGQDNQGYWILYQNWRISHRDLLLQIDDTDQPLFSFRDQIRDVAATFRELEGGVPAPERELFEKLLDDYEDLRQIARLGGNRNILRQRLTGMQRIVRDHFHPDVIAAASPDASRPAIGTDEPSGGDSSGTTTGTEIRTEEGLLVD